MREMVGECQTAMNQEVENLEKKKQYARDVNEEIRQQQQEQQALLQAELSKTVNPPLNNPRYDSWEEQQAAYRQRQAARALNTERDLEKVSGCIIIRTYILLSLIYFLF